MNVKDAALQILKDVGRPLGSQQLAGLILETGLWTTEGQTLVATNYAQMITEIRRTQQNGGRPRFIPHGRGYLCNAPLHKYPGAAI